MFSSSSDVPPIPRISVGSHLTSTKHRAVLLPASQWALKQPSMPSFTACQIPEEVWSLLICMCVCVCARSGVNIPCITLPSLEKHPLNQHHPQVPGCTLCLHEQTSHHTEVYENIPTEQHTPHPFQSVNYHQFTHFCFPWDNVWVLWKNVKLQWEGTVSDASGNTLHLIPLKKVFKIDKSFASEHILNLIMTRSQNDPNFLFSMTPNKRLIP